jgi:hypothetical protein
VHLSQGTNNGPDSFAIQDPTLLGYPVPWTVASVFSANVGKPAFFYWNDTKPKTYGVSNMAIDIVAYTRSNMVPDILADQVQATNRVAFPVHVAVRVLTTISLAISYVCQTG